MKIKIVHVFVPGRDVDTWSVGECVHFIHADCDGVYVRFVEGHSPAQITYSSMPYKAEYEFEEKGGQNGSYS